MPSPLYINTSFENGSPMNWEERDDGTLVFEPLFDYERGFRNRQLTHWHFSLRGTKGQTVRLRIPPKENIYGGKRVNAFAPRIGNQMSADGVSWTPVVFEQGEDRSIEATVTLPADEVVIARIEPYTTKHLAGFLARLGEHPLAKIKIIGRTVEGRPLEMITLSSGRAKRSALIRARAHPWEAGGNWFIEGLAARALSDPAVLDAMDLCILPMAAKDGVVRGQTRFNANGFDLNRGFVKDYVFNEHNAPENLALMKWLERRQRERALPFFAMDLHDDDWGKLHVGDMDKDKGYAKRMTVLDELMREHSYYTEGLAAGAGAATFGAGLRDIFSIDSVVYELNSNWLAGARAVPDSKIWKTFGAQFADVLARYAEACPR